MPDQGIDLIVGTDIACQRIRLASGGADPGRNCIDIGP